jgi:hypothetical protein
MLKVDEIKAAIESLTEHDFAKLRKWFLEKDWREWKHGDRHKLLNFSRRLVLPYAKVERIG